MEDSLPERTIFVGGKLVALAISNNGKTTVGCTNSRLHIWNEGSRWKPTADIQGLVGDVDEVAVTPDGFACRCASLERSHLHGQHHKTTSDTSGYIGPNDETQRSEPLFIANSIHTGRNQIGCLRQRPTDSDSSTFNIEPHC